MARHNVVVHADILVDLTHRVHTQELVSWGKPQAISKDENWHRLKWYASIVGYSNVEAVERFLFFRISFSVLYYGVSIHKVEFQKFTALFYNYCVSLLCKMLATFGSSTIIPTIPHQISINFHSKLVQPCCFTNRAFNKLPMHS